MDRNEQIKELDSKLSLLLKRQELFAKEIYQLKHELSLLKSEQEEQPVKPVTPEVSEEPPKPKAEPQKPASLYEQRKREAAQTVQDPALFQPVKKQVAPPKAPKVAKPKKKSDFERFIGENLISKIGILITVIGLAIFGKYSIDNDLINPVTRIVLGYVSGAVLLGIGIKLKAKYTNYSAVLVSGAMATMYFMTFFAYSFYDLIPQIFSFVLMVVFTGFTVFAALQYNRQVIAHIGLVGAYAVPFLLSDGSGRVAVLFTYMAILNLGILAISIKKYWKPLYYMSFALTWVIVGAWLGTKYEESEHFGLAMLFSSIFFITFYISFLIYKLAKQAQFVALDVVLLLANSFVFYSIGYGLLLNHEVGQHLLGIFTVINAIVHFIVSFVLYSKKLADRNLFYMASGLVMIFITMAVPVQLDGNWVTLLWAGEALLLFWIGRSKKVVLYENLSYPLMLLAFGSLVHDWGVAYSAHYSKGADTGFNFLLNIHFLTSVLFIGMFGAIIALMRKMSKDLAPTKWDFMRASAVYFVPVLLIIGAYFAFSLEISRYFYQAFEDSYLAIQESTSDYARHIYDYDLNKFKRIWLINYTALFVTVLGVLNLYKFKNIVISYSTIFLSVITIFMFLTLGLLQLSELRENMLEQTNAEYYDRGFYHVFIRYISYAFFVVLIGTIYRYVQKGLFNPAMRILFDYFLHVTFIWVLSSELIHWMDMADSKGTYKLGLSILWGVYSLFLIVMGIAKKLKYLRIGAIVLFGITLIKLFAYDVSHLETIAKIIVFVSLGGLLLIISFLYNKYKHLMVDAPTEEKTINEPDNISQDENDD